MMPDESTTQASTKRRANAWFTRSRRMLADGACAVVLIFGVGCSQRLGTDTNFSSRPVVTTEVAGVMDVAEATLVDLGYTISSRDQRSGVIRTAPQTVEGDNTGRQITTRNSGRVRRVVEVRVNASERPARVLCKVSLQQQSTEALRVLAREHGGSDVPSETAIDRDAYATPEQNTVWRTVRRDMTIERTILTEIQRRLGGTPE